MGVSESNEHFFLHCRKFVKQRSYLKNSIKDDLKKVEKRYSIEVLLGFFPDVFKSKIKVKKHKSTIKRIMKSVLDYIRDTKRFDP